MKKRMMAGLLTLCMAVTLLPATASAAGNIVSPASWDDVQTAIDNASPGDTIDLSGLAMKNPTPKENFTSRPQLVVDKDLTITAGGAAWSKNIWDITRSQYMNIELKNNATLTLYSILIEGGQDNTPTIYGDGNVILGGVADAAKNTEIDGYGSCWAAGETNSPAVHVSGDVTVGEKSQIRGGCSVLWRYHFTSPPIADDTTAQAGIISDNGTVTVNDGRVMGGGVVSSQIKGTLIGGAGIIAPTVVVAGGSVDGGSGTNAGGVAIVADDVTLYAGEIGGGNGLDKTASTAGAAIEAANHVQTVDAGKKTLTVKGGYAVPECAPAIDCDGDVSVDGGTIQGGTYGMGEAACGSAIKAGTGTITLSGDAFITQATGNTKTCFPVIESKGNISIAEGVHLRNGGSGVANNHPHEPSGHLIVTTGTVTMTGGLLEMYPFSNADDNGSAVVGAEKLVMTGGKIEATENIVYNHDATMGAPAIKNVKTVEIGGDAQVTGFLSRSRFSSNTDYKAASAGPAVSGADTVVISGNAVVTGGHEMQYNAYTTLLTAIKTGGDAIENCKDVTVKENAVVAGGAHTINYMNYSRAGDGISGADVVRIEDQAKVLGGAAVKNSLSGGKGGNGISDCSSITLEEGVTVSGGAAEYANYGGMGIKMSDAADAILVARGKISGGGNGAAIGNIHGTVFVDGGDKAGAALSSAKNTIQMADTGLTILRNGTITAGGKAFTGGRYYKDVARDYMVTEASASDANQLFALELTSPLNTAAVTPAAAATAAAPDGTQYVLYDDGGAITLTASDTIGEVTAEYHRATDPAGGEYVTEADAQTALALTVSGNTAGFTMPADDLRLGAAAPVAHVVFKIQNGTWADGTATDKTVSIPLVNDKGTLSASDVPTGMIANSGYEGGAWDAAPNTAADAITGNVTYTYRFTKQSGGGGGGGTTYYTLDYETNGGSKIASERHTSGTVVKLTKIPTREGHTFSGWYADKELTDNITEIKMNGNKTVYAGWKATGVPDGLNGDDHFAYINGYPDGFVRPTADITRAEVAAIFYRLLKDEVRAQHETAENTFSDSEPGQWYNTAVSTLANMGVIKGRSASVFDPDAYITRAEFAAIAARFDSERYKGGNLFTDIDGHWAAEQINRAAQKGWVTGYQDGTFRPDSNITRAESMTLINRVLGRLPETKTDLLSGMVVWPDNPDSEWYFLAVQEASNGHSYERKADGVHEKWTKLNRD